MINVVTFIEGKNGLKRAKAKRRRIGMGNLLYLLVANSAADNALHP